MESQLILRTADRKRNLTFKKLLRVHIVTAGTLSGLVCGAPCLMHKDECLKHSGVRIAEAQGELLASVIKAILGDLGLNKNEQTDAPAIVRRHLLALAR